MQENRLTGQSWDEHSKHLPDSTITEVTPRTRGAAWWVKCLGMSNRSYLVLGEKGKGKDFLMDANFHFGMGVNFCKCGDGDVTS